MKVRELVEELAALPPDLPVAVELDRTYEAAVLTAHRRNDRLGPRVVLGLDDEQVDQFSLSLLP